MTKLPAVSYIGKNNKNMLIVIDNSQSIDIYFFQKCHYCIKGNVKVHNIHHIALKNFQSTLVVNLTGFYLFSKEISKSLSVHRDIEALQNISRRKDNIIASA